MPKCPVCEKGLSEPIPPFCSTCGWDLKNDLTLVPSIGGIPEKIVKEYRQRLSLARKNWKELEESEREHREMEKKLKLFESRLAEMESQIKDVRKAPVKEEVLTSEWIEPITGMIFIHVPAGKFMMGDTFEDGYDDEKPVHEVELDGFYLGKYPVTQGQWKKIIGENPSFFKKGDDHPVECVSWYDALGFIDKLKERSAGRYGFSLPSEAQWEYAARSGGKKERYAGDEDMECVAWYNGNGGSSTHPVGKKQPNGLGIYDMSGNVWEWCQDIHNGDAYKNHVKKNPVDNDGASSYRVIRGGSWVSAPWSVRCAHRDRNDSTRRLYYVGFRLARK